MKFEAAKPDERMSASGAAVLRSIQNDSLPVVDLVIREAFQNSLDAKIDGESCVRIDVNVKRNLLTSEISPFFEGITNELNEKLPKETMLLSIADMNTVGLTGEYERSDTQQLDESNIYKLIYGLFMNQEKGDAGGSWGLGKTSFYRIGCGIVIYYTRIKTNSGNYEERLAACLIEDSKKENAILPDHLRGIAWWGEKDDSSTSIYDKSYPITDQSVIHEFLEVLKIKPYVEEQTGTNIIIPFIQEKNTDIKIEEDALNEGIHWWEDSLEESIKISIQRWYSPRLINSYYKEEFDDPYLVCRLNEDLIMIPENNQTFNTFKKLYTAALINETPNEKIKVKNVFLKKIGMDDTSEPVGRIAYQRVSLTDLQMVNGSGLSPLAYIGHSRNPGSQTSKILAYARKPGMIVEYIVDDNEWMKGVQVSEDDFVFAFFVPNSDGKLHHRYQPKFETLENYLRATENADHANWKDIIIDNYQATIISRLKKEVSKIMSEDLGESLEEIGRDRTSALSRKYGQIFLPRVGFGKAGNTPEKRTRETNNSNKKRGKTAGIKILSFERRLDKTIKVHAEIIVTENSEFQLQIDVSTTDSELNPKKWKKRFGESIEYPFDISSVELLESDSAIKHEKHVFKNNSDSIRVAKLSFVLIAKDQTMQPIIKLVKAE